MDRKKEGRFENQGQGVTMSSSRPRQGRWLPLGERHMKEKMSLEEPEQEEDPKGRERIEVGSKRKIL